MWELLPRAAVDILAAMTAAGARDPALCTRVARKVLLQLDVPGALGLDDVVAAAEVMAGQEHRDLDLFRGLAQRGVDLAATQAAGAAAAGRILQSMRSLDIDELPDALVEAANGGA